MNRQSGFSAAGRSQNSDMSSWRQGQDFFLPTGGEWDGHMASYHNEPDQLQHVCSSATHPLIPPRSQGGVLGGTLNLLFTTDLLLAVYEIAYN